MGNKRPVIITGASSGIGAALVEVLAEEGHRLFICARRMERLLDLALTHDRVEAFECDVADEEQVGEFIGRITEQTDSVLGLITAAGWFGAIGPMVETDSAEWKAAIETNLFGVYHLVKHAHPLLKADGHGRIVNFAGGGAFGVFENYSAYAVSKSAVVRLTENLAVELAEDGIAVNAVAPGFVATEIHDRTIELGPELAGAEHYEMTLEKMKAGAVPMELPVELVRFLLSDRAEGLTGKTISASFDPWRSDEFAANIMALNESELYTLGRINLVNLESCSLRAELTKASNKGTTNG